jgi:hypothetical protein
MRQLITPAVVIAALLAGITPTFAQQCTAQSVAEQRGKFGQGSEYGRMLVVVDPAYFRKDLAPEAAQLVTLLWRWEGDSAASAAWRASFERRFRSMVDR